jgi:hypothetical protein
MEWAVIPSLIVAVASGIVSVWSVVSRTRREARADTIQEYVALVKTLREEVGQLKQAQEATLQRAQEAEARVLATERQLVRVEAAHEDCLRLTAALRQKVQRLEEQIGEPRRHKP